MMKRVEIPFIPSLFAALTLLEVARRRRSRGTAAGIVLTALAGTATLSFFLTAESIPYSLNTLLVSTPSELASYGARRLAQLPRWPIVILEFTALVLYSLVPGTTALNVAYFSPVLLITLSVSILGVLALYRLLVSLNIAYEFLKFFGRNLITIFVHRVYMYTLFSITAATDLHLRGFPCSRERGELPLETIRCQRTRFLGRSLGASP